MPTARWTVTDVAGDEHVESLTLGPDDVNGRVRGFSIVKRTLRGGPRDGLDSIEVDNGRLKFVVLPTRGMGLWKGWCDGLELGWKSPVAGPVHPKFVPVGQADGIGWLAGFDEWFVRCGLESNGAPEFDASGRVRYPLHGRIANLPAHKVEIEIDDEAEEIRVIGEVDESRLFGPNLRLRTTIATRAGQPGLTIIDEITNRSAGPGELELLYHINFGPPLCAAEAELLAPVRNLVPRTPHAARGIGHWSTYQPEQFGAEEEVFYFELEADDVGETQALLRGPEGDRGVSIRFNKRELPLFILWKLPRPEADGYVTGIEPAINFPNPRSFEKEQGRVAELASGATRRFAIAIDCLTDAGSVRAAEERIATLQSRVQPTIHDSPQQGWVPI